MVYELDKIRKLDVTYKTVELIQEVGVDVRVVGKGLPFKTVKTILWASMCVEDKSLTLDMVGDLVFEHSNMQIAMEKALYVMNKLIPFLTGKTLEEIEAEAKIKEESGDEETKNEQAQA